MIIEGAIGKDIELNERMENFFKKKVAVPCEKK